MRRIRLYGASARPAELEDRAGGVGVGLVPGGEHHERLRHGQAQRVGARHDRRLGHRLVLDEHALELERADPVVGRLEDVVGAPDVGDVAVGVALGDVAGVVVAVAHHVGGALRIVEVADHQAERPARQVEAISPSSAGLPSASSSATV